MTDISALQAVVDHADYYALADTILAVGVTPRIKVTLQPAEGHNVQRAVQRIQDWGRSIGARDVARHDESGRLTVRGTLRCGTPVSVEMLTRIQHADPVSVPLEEVS